MAVKELPLLEELELSLCDNVGRSEVFKFVLKCLRLLAKYAHS